jgi:hypothetical protein
MQEIKREKLISGKEYYLQYIHNGTTYNLYVPYGNYNSSTLSSYLQTTLTYDSNSNWTITINKATGLFTFTSTQAFTLKGAISTIASILGISKTDNNSTLISPYTLTCPYPVNLLGIKKLKVASATLAVNSADSWAGGFCNIIGTIPVNQPSYGLIQYMNSGNPHGNLRSKTVDLIDIQVLDEFNNLVNFNNVNWTLSLELIILRQLTITPFNFPTQNILELPRIYKEQHRGLSLQWNNTPRRNYTNKEVVFLQRFIDFFLLFFIWIVYSLLVSLLIVSLLIVSIFVLFDKHFSILG